MSKKVKITVLKAEYYEDLAEKYAIPHLGKCPFHSPGQTFISDGIHKPEGLCEYAWSPMKDMAGQLSEGKLVQPSGTWLNDDTKGVFTCIDGVRPVIMLVEAEKQD